MTKTIDLNAAARSQDAGKFRTAVREARGKQHMGAERFTASGDGKAPAPVRPKFTRRT